MSDLFPLFAESAPDVGWPDKPRYLMSYAYVREDMMELCRQEGVDLIVDSGAFTTASKGKQMDHEAYLDWLLENAEAITFALSYDVIGDHHSSRENHTRALDRIGDAVKMVPTWHLGSPMEELERLCGEYDFVCIGGAVPFAKAPDSLYRAVSQAHRIAARFGTKLHGLGMTGNRILHGLPWYSVDSSAWLSACRFPSMPLANREGRIVQFEHGVYLDNLSRELVRQYGGDPAVVASPGWSLKATIGAELCQLRRLWVMTACARGFMYLEGYKGAHQPEAPIKVYLSGDSGNPGGAVAAIVKAHRMGSPWAPDQAPSLWDATVPHPLLQLDPA